MVSNLLVHNLPASSAYKLDRLVNTPTATKALLDESEEECENDKDPVVENLTSTAQDMGKKFGRSLSNSKVGGHLLTLGEKFSSEEAFLRFIGLPGKGKRGNKRNRNEDEDKEEVNIEAKEDSIGTDNDAFKTEVDQTPIPPPRKKRKEGGMDITKLRSVLADENTLPQKQNSIDCDKKLKKTLAEEAKMKLSASRFRYLNEQLYSQPGNASAKLFKSDPTLFSSYYHGYQLQAAQWPLDPLNAIISDCLRLDDKAVIADFGCGEARLARSVENKVHSFDLVALNERVTACDMANVPLEDSTVDVAVFCLSLMGTNIRDFLFEAARVLKVGGTLKIAELESRFQGESCSVDTFIDSVGKFGFKNSWKDLKKDFFYFLDFQKVRDVKKKKKLPDIELKPRLYKKRSPNVENT